MRNYSDWVKSLDTRRVLYALHVLSQDVNGIVIENNPDYLISIIKELDEAFQQDILKNMEEKVKIGILDDAEISWLKEDLRAALWFGTYYNKGLFIDNPIYLLPLCNYYPSYIDNLILNIDIQTFNTEAVKRANETILMDKLTVKTTPTNLLDNEHLSYLKVMKDSKKHTSNDSQPNNFEVLTPNITDKVLPPSKYTVNSIEYGLSFKKASLDYAKFHYEASLRTKDKDISWLDKNNKIQLSWATEYLKKTPNLFSVSFSPKNDEEVFQQICAILDVYSLQYAYRTVDTNQIVFGNLAEKELFILKMRNSWNQKNFRDKKDIDSAMQSFLRKKTHKQLVEIANSYNVSIREVLEELIKNEHEKLKS